MEMRGDQMSHSEQMIENQFIQILVLLRSLKLKYALSELQIS